MVANSDFSLQVFFLIAFADDEEHDLQAMAQAISGIEHHVRIRAAQWRLANRFIVGYSGNLGRAHELGILLDAADRLRHRLELVFLIIGEGNQKENLQAEVAVGNHGRGLANVLFKP